MSDDIQPLSDDERAELEALRAEKAAREERERAARERAELEELRRQRDEAAARPQAQARQTTAARAAEAAEERRIKEARERGARLMEPDDDLRMPVGQKVVLGVIALLVAIIVIMHFFVG